MELISDEEELINAKPRCLWPDDGRDYSAQAQEQEPEEDDYYKEDQQLDQYEQYVSNMQAILQAHRRIQLTYSYVCIIADLSVYLLL